MKSENVFFGSHSRASIGQKRKTFIYIFIFVQLMTGRFQQMYP